MFLSLPSAGRTVSSLPVTPVAVRAGLPPASMALSALLLNMPHFRGTSLSSEAWSMEKELSDEA